MAQFVPTHLEDAAFDRLAQLIHRSLPEKWRSRTDVPTLGLALRSAKEQLEMALQEGHDSEHWRRTWERALRVAFQEESPTVQREIGAWLDLLERSLGIEDGKLVVAPPDEARLIVYFDQVAPPQPESMIRLPRPGAKPIQTILSGEKFRLSLGFDGVQAKGALRLTDPLARFRFDGLSYDAERGRLFAGSSDAHVSDFFLRFKGIREDGNKGVLDEPRLGLNLGFVRVADVAAKSVEYDLGGALIHSAKFRVLGIPVLHRKAWALDFDPGRSPGQPARFRFERLQRVLQLAKPPSISLLDSAPKVSYNNTYTEGNAWNANLALDASKRFPLSSTFQVTWNLSDRPESSLGVLSEAFLRNELGGMFTANTGIRSLPERATSLRTRKFNLHAGTSHNTIYPVRRPNLPDDLDTISFPFYAGLELGGPIGPFGGSVQFRFNQVESRQFGKEGRWGAIGSFGVARGRLSRGLFYDVVVDGSVFNPGPRRFAWVRPSAELHARVLPWLRLSGGLSNWKSFGTPRTAFDDIPNGNQLHGRVDFLLGATEISYANSYRVRDKSWYRSRVFVSQVVGAWRLEVSTDERFQGASLGLGLRLDSLLDGLQRRRPTGVRLEAQTPDSP